MAAYKSVTIQGTIGSVDDAGSEIESLASEMREWADNLEEKFSATEKYTAVSEAADALEGITMPEVPSVIAQVNIRYSESVPTRKGRGASRAVRMGNAVSVLECAKEAAETWLEGLPEKDENKEAVEQFVSDLDDVISECEGVEFPGMY